MTRDPSNPPPATHAFIGLGGNQGDVPATFRIALARLEATPGVEIGAVSSLYRTSPVGLTAQPDFINAAAELVVTLSGPELLAVLLETERQAGRDRSASVRWGPRPLDLDLLIFGDALLSTPSLTVPHPRMTERRFVLEPLAEIAPTLLIPGTSRTVGAWRDRVAMTGDAADRVEGVWFTPRAAWRDGGRLR